MDKKEKYVDMTDKITENDEKEVNYWRGFRKLLPGIPSSGIPTTVKTC